MLHSYLAAIPYLPEQCPCTLLILGKQVLSSALSVCTLQQASFKSIVQYNIDVVLRVQLKWSVSWSAYVQGNWVNFLDLSGGAKKCI